MFQIDPRSNQPDGLDRLSKFLRDPSKPTDELRRRSAGLQRLLCGASETQVTFVIDNAGFTHPGQDIAIVGSIPELGNWSFAAGGLRLDGASFPTWSGTVTLPRNASFEFKAIEVEGTQTIRWELSDTYGAGS